MKRYYILAGNHAQATFIAKRMHLSQQEFVYISGVERMLGIRNEVMLCYGTWKSRQDLPEIMTHAKVREMSIVYVDT